MPSGAPEPSCSTYSLEKPPVLKNSGHGCPYCSLRPQTNWRQLGQTDWPGGRTARGGCGPSYPPLAQLRQLARRWCAVFDEVAQVLGQVTARAPDLGEDRPSCKVTDHAAGVELGLE